VNEPSDRRLSAQRAEMLEQLVADASSLDDSLGRGFLKPQVLAAMAEVPRHAYLPDNVRNLAYCDTALPIGYGKTTSQPFVVALMTDLLDIEPHHRVLEIGTGLGYQTAVLARLARSVHSIEIVDSLAAKAAANLHALGIENATVGVGDGRGGWHTCAPFDRIIVTAAPQIIPRALLHQLAEHGRMVIPAGLSASQRLLVVQKSSDGHLQTREVMPVSFAPLLHESANIETGEDP
jgi:protein-L-isoaspartate(D-aspartate) O-methyltransferase